MVMRLHAVLAILVVALAAAAQEDPLPAGEGKDVVVRVCSPCHGVYPIAQRHRTKEAWEGLVDNMESRGAKGTDADFKTVVRYLVKNFGVLVPDKININRASARILTNFFKLFPEEGEAIVAYREQNGDFKEWQDLKKVPRLDANKIERRKESITF